MLGAIIGDIVGSKYEFQNIKSKDFTFFQPDMFFTDDTIMTVAIFDALYSCQGNFDKLENLTILKLREYGKKYPGNGKIGYGKLFEEWINSKNPRPYNSFGNGSAMRISAVPYFASNLNELKEISFKVTSVTHNHPEGIKGAEAVAVAIYLAKNGFSKEKIKNEIEKYYNLNFDYEDLRENYTYKVSCQRTVPEAIFCFLISNSFEDAIRTGISIGGDSDTICAIIGGIAEAFYGIPEDIKTKALNYLDNDLKTQVELFYDFVNFQKEL